MPKRKIIPPDPIDVIVGKRLRDLRLRAGISQTKLGERLGLSFQQIQKYERATDRISAARLYQLALTFNISISQFYGETSQNDWHTEIDRLKNNGELDRQDASTKPEVFFYRETSEFIRSYVRIKDSKQRRAIQEIIKLIGDLQSD